MSGLASGLDIDSLVSKLMKAERTSLDTMVKKAHKGRVATRSISRY
ncbi:flagellar cap protein FliD N-terminal domain-containing protein [Cohnella rhizosphaerae]